MKLIHTSTIDLALLALPSHVSAYPACEVVVMDREHGGVFRTTASPLPCANLGLFVVNRSSDPVDVSGSICYFYLDEKGKIVARQQQIFYPTPIHPSTTAEIVKLDYQGVIQKVDLTKVKVQKDTTVFSTQAQKGPGGVTVTVQQESLNAGQMKKKYGFCPRH